MVVAAAAAGLAGAAAAAAGWVGLGASAAAGFASAGLAALAGGAAGGAAPPLHAARITPMPPTAAPDARRNRRRRLSVDRACTILHLRPRHLDTEGTRQDTGDPIQPDCPEDAAPVRSITNNENARS